MTGWDIARDPDEEQYGPTDSAPQDGGMADQLGWLGIQNDPLVIEEGNQLGQVIDTEDDSDNGGIPPLQPVLGYDDNVPDSREVFGVDPSIPTVGEVES